MFHSIKELVKDGVENIDAKEIATFKLRHMSNMNDNQGGISEETVHIYERVTSSNHIEKINSTDGNLENVQKFIELSDDEIIEECTRIVKQYENTSTTTSSRNKSKTKQNQGDYAGTPKESDLNVFVQECLREEPPSLSLGKNVNGGCWEEPLPLSSEKIENAKTMLQMVNIHTNILYNMTFG